MAISVAKDIPGDRELARRLLWLAGPIIATNLSRTAMGFVDFIMVSQLGTEAQAAITPATLVVFCPIAFGMGFMSAVNTFVSQAFGRQRLEECGAYAWQGIYVSFALALLAVPIFLIAEPLYASSGSTGDVVRMQVAYTQIAAFSLGPTVLATALANFFNGIHRPSVGLVAMIVSNLFNVLANYALIFGKLGFPALGIAGAAWATLAAVVLQAAILMGWFLAPEFRRRFHTLRAWRFSYSRQVALARIGWPVGGLFAADLITWTIFTLYLIAHFGPAQLAAHNVCFKWLELSFMPAYGVSMAVTASVGKAIGERRRDIARRYGRLGMIFTMLYMGAMGVMMIVFRKELPALLSDDGEVILWASRLLILYACFQLFDAANLAYAGALRGAGDNAWPAAVWLASAVIVLLGGGWLMMHLRPQWQSLAPWSAACLHAAILGLAMWLRWRRGPWERIELLGHEGAEKGRELDG